MESLRSDDSYRESWQNCALDKHETKVIKLNDEQVDVTTQNSKPSSKNTTFKDADVTLSIEKKKLQSELDVHMEKLPIVKAERDINVDKLSNYSSEEKDDKYIIDKCNEKTIKEEYFLESEIIVQEELDIKDENEEQNQFTTKYFDPVYEKSRKTFTCRYCYTVLSTEEFKNAHEPRCKFRKKEQHLKGRTFECLYCKLLYIRKGDKNKHQALCKKRKKSEKYEEGSKTKSERKYCCDKCDYETQWKKSLVVHIRIHHMVNAPKYSCNQCAYQTIGKSNLNIHLRIHNGFGLICMLCHKSFKYKCDLDGHYLSRHPSRSDKWGSTITSKINECPKCLYKTVKTSHFKDHLATHGTAAGQAKFKCNICGYKSIKKGHFTVHLRLHVGQLPYVCTECDKRFNTKQNLDGHIISRHSENEELISSVTSKVHQCDKCGYKTINNFNFKEHLKICL